MKSHEVGFPKLEIKGKGTFRPPNAKPLTRESQISDYVVSKTIGGARYAGVLKEWDSNVAIIELSDGRKKGIEC